MLVELCRFPLETPALTSLLSPRPAQLMAYLTSPPGCLHGNSKSAWSFSLPTLPQPVPSHHPSTCQRCSSIISCPSKCLEMILTLLLQLLSLPDSPCLQVFLCHKQTSFYPCLSNVHCPGSCFRSLIGVLGSTLTSLKAVLYPVQDGSWHTGVPGALASLTLPSHPHSFQLQLGQGFLTPQAVTPLGLPTSVLCTGHSPFLVWLSSSSASNLNINAAHILPDDPF